MNFTSTSASQSNIIHSDESIPRKDIVISIIFSESTASLLQISAPNLEDIVHDDSSTSLFSFRSLNLFRNHLAAKRASGHSLNEFFSKSNIDSINSDVIYIAKNFDSTISNDCDDDVFGRNEEQFMQKPSLLMEKYKVYTRPLLTAKTTAHENKIKCQLNTIYVSVLESELTITSSGWVNFCRICHGGESVANLITPCRCRGSIALAHLQCLEEWLKQSANSKCELCQHHYEVIRQPKYTIPWSILVFLTHPGDRWKEVVFDLFGFLIYTPTAIASTYLLMILCDNITVKHGLQYNKNFTSHFLALTAVFGMATIDFTYSSWLVVTLQKQVDAWKQWYQNNCTIRVVLPPRKLRRYKRKKKELIAQLD